LVGTLLGDSDSYVRWEAARALQLLGDSRALPALVEALVTDDNSYVRYAAAETLGELADASAIDALETALLYDDNEYVRYAAAKSLGQIADLDAVPALLRALHTRNSHVWHAAAEALWALEEPVVDRVIEHLLDKNETMRKAALKAIIWLTTEWDDDQLADRDDLLPGSGYGWWN
jgi:HEAT repeat protein